MRNGKWVGRALAGISIAALWAGGAVAQQRPFNLRAGRAVVTLPDFAMQSGLQIIAAADQLGDKMTPAIHGTYDVRSALRQLIAGTNLTIASDSNGLITLRDRGTVAASFRPVAFADYRQADTAAEAPAPAPEAPPPETASSSQIPADDIVIVGSQIQGSKVTDALPVTVVGKTQIANTAAVSGDELFRSIPQMGSITFNSQYIPGSSNSPRGDVGSVNLRELGPGNTLVLLNGRRVVQHPVSTADENLVPVISYNTNAIPVSGVQRLEVLRDGAAAIYGTDAVAGVVNTVLQEKFSGVALETQYGYATGTNLRESTSNATVGHNFEHGNITLFASYTHRDALYASDQNYTSSADKRALFAGTRFAGATSLDGRSANSAFASLSTPVTTAVRVGGTAITTAAGLFHIQPTGISGCGYGGAPLTGGTCIGSGTLATAGAARDTRYDSSVADNTTIMPKLDRINLFMTGQYEVSPDVTVYGEAGYYHAKTVNRVGATGTLSSVLINVPASNYWNPFGATTINGVANPNRISGLVGVPAAGLPVTIRAYTFSDAGANTVIDRNNQLRLLTGIKFPLFGFKWDSAAVYSRAHVSDWSTGISATQLQQNLALATPDAYNIFNGGNTGVYSQADTSPSSQAALNAIRISTVRKDTTTLAMADLKGSNAALLHLPGGDVGFALGGEIRRETQFDNRDPRVDGTTTFTDSVSGILYPSDLIGTSPNPDTRGRRTVASAYGELAIPVVSPEMNIPLIRKIELQVAGRYEHYSDIGSVAKPKVAGSWDLVDGVRLRASWAQGFKAPNLEQINATLITRSNTRTDYVRCQADLTAGRITSFANCGQSFATSVQRAGNPDLKPEESETWSAGVVLQPKFIPSQFGRFTITADLWHVKQTGIVGLFGEGNALILDYLMRQQGSSNPNVIRAAPTSDDQALFAGTGLAPAGLVLFVRDQYRNLLPQTASGIDMGLNWQLNNTPAGSFSLDVNVAYLRKFYRDPSPDIAALLAARAASQINAGTTITGGGDLIQFGSRPRWRGTSSLTWSLKQVQLGAYAQYTGPVDDTALIDSTGDYWRQKSLLIGNLYVQLTMPAFGNESKYRLRLGVRNIADAKPPLVAAGYNGDLYNPYGRYLYVNARVEF